MSVSDDDNLVQEMKALVRRYGGHKCQKALRTVVSSSVPTMIRKKCVEPEFIDITPGGFEYGFSQLINVFLLGDVDHKISLRLMPDTTPNCLDFLFTTLEKYYDSILHLRSIDSMHESQRVESRFQTLYLSVEPLETVTKVLERNKVVALFENITLVGGGNKRKINNSIMRRIKELVVKGGAISSLTITGCSLEDDDFVQLGRMLQTNRLESIALVSTHLAYKSTDLVYLLTKSFKIHAQTFSETSALKILDFGDTLDGMDYHQLRELFNAIGTLPRLESYGISTRDPNLLEILAGSIGNWKIRRLALDCRVRSEYIDFRPLFDAIACSRQLRVLTLGFTTSPSKSTCRYLYDLALSPIGGLVKVFVYGPVDLRHLSALVPKDVDATIAAQRQIRRFPFQIRQILKEEKEYRRMVQYLRGLVHLLSKQLPYLHSIGLTIDDWKRYKNTIFNGKQEALELWDQVWAQIEENRVGMTLFHPEVLPTVPAGLWSTVLYNAITCEPDPEELRWTSIYQMVRNLVVGGQIG